MRLTPDIKIIFLIDFETQYAVYDPGQMSSDKNIGKSVFIEDSVMQSEIFDKLDSFWWSNNDKIIQFTYASDGSYLFRRKKKIVNLKNPSEINWVEYEWFNVTNVDGEKFFKIVLDAFKVSVEIEQKTVKDSIKNYYGNPGLSWVNNFKRDRDKVLKESDWMFSVDIVDTIEPEKLELWKTYRQKMRDVPRDNKEIKEAWKWLIPLNPDEWKAFNEKVTEEYVKKHNYSVDASYLSVPQHFVTAKQNVAARNNEFTGEEKSEMIAASPSQQLDNLLSSIIES